MIAVPSILIVAPRGTVKEATLLSTPTLSVTARKVTGMVAPLDAVLKAKAIGARILTKKRRGLNPVIARSSSE